MSDFAKCPSCHTNENVAVFYEPNGKIEEQYWLMCKACGLEGPKRYDGVSAIDFWNYNKEGGIIGENLSAKPKNKKK